MADGVEMKPGHEIEQELSSGTDLVPVAGPGFDYAGIPAEIAETQRERAARILGLAHRGLELTAQIGHELLAAQAELEHGSFLPWIEGALGMSKSAAYRAMDIAERFTSAELPVVKALPVAVVYKLAEKTTPVPVREAVLRRMASGEALQGEVVLEEVRAAREAAKTKAAEEKEAARLAKLSPEAQAAEAKTAKSRNQRRADAERKEAERRIASEAEQRARDAEAEAGAAILVASLGAEAATRFAMRFSNHFTNVMGATIDLAGRLRAEHEPITTLEMHQIERIGRLASYRVSEDDRERARAMAQDIGFEGKAPVMTVIRDARRQTVFRLASDPIVFLALVDQMERTEAEVRIVPPLPPEQDAGDPADKPAARARGQKAKADRKAPVAADA